MSIYRRSGLVFKPTGVFQGILTELKKVDLRPVQKIEYKFDPFHRSAKDVRDLHHFFSQPQIRDSNFKCVSKISILSDLSDPEINVKLENGKQILFKTSNLSVLEILQEFNKIVLPLVPPPEETKPVTQTKSQKRK